MTLPNFLIVGEIKAGTSSVYEYCAAHPQIFMSPVKETRFFSHEKGHFGRHGRITTLEEYADLFDGVTDETAIGEASPQYIHSLNAAQRIRQLLPDVKLIASIRNPVDRIYSEYVMSVRAREEEREFIEMFREDSKSGAWAIESSFPYANLKRYYDLFDASQIKVVLFDNLKAQPETVVAEIFEFLGVDSAFIPDTTQIYNKGGIPKNQALHSSLVWLRRSTAGRARSIAKTVLPKSLFTSARKRYEENLQKAPSLTQEQRQEVTDFYRDDLLKLEQLVGRDLSGWLNLPVM
tara:strand:+ start:864 stop:1739 length:876 start_codon:yes stop_codon:yes gene_type:complete